MVSVRVVRSVEISPLIEFGWGKGIVHGTIVLEKSLALRPVFLYTKKDHRSPALHEGYHDRSQRFHQLQPYKQRLGEKLALAKYREP